MKKEFKLIDFLKSNPVSLSITDLRKKFEDNCVLRGLSLEVLKGETLVILGGSGAGKSVLLKHIVGLLKPDSGDIEINNKSIINNGALNEFNIGYVFQSSALFSSMTVEENVALYLTEHRVFSDKSVVKSLVNDALSIVGLEGCDQQYPSELSGGMKRRVATARAIVMNPDLILFDEPTTGLDPVMTKTIGDLILNLKRNVNVTQIVVTHDIELAFYIGDRISIICDGVIAEVGTAREIAECKNPAVVNMISPKFEIRNGG
ncbi:MAG: ABC transporter ATP-binding protein [Thermodesulfobacteriota bacterium]